MNCQGFYLLFFWNRCSSFHSGKNHCLADSRKGIFFFHACCCCQKRADSRHYIIRDSKLIQLNHLLSVRSVNCRIPCMYPGYSFPLLFCLFHDSNHLRKRHLGAVIYFCIWSGPCQNLRIYQRAGIDNHICLLNQPFSLHCN